MANTDLAKMVEQIIKEAGITGVIYETIMQEISKYFYVGVDNIEKMININFDTLNPRVINYLKEYNFNLVKDMNTELANKLRSTITRNMITGDKKNMVREIKATFDTTLSRAKAIARTETARAYAFGNYAGAMEAKKKGYNVKKYWLAVIDNRTCPICRRLHTKYPKEKAIAVDKEFIDEKWRGITHPVHPNCRCDVIYFLE